MRGVANIIYFNSADADRAQTEMNYTVIGSYQIIVRAPTMTINATDPTILVVRSVPLDMKSEEFYDAFAQFGNLLEASLAVESATGRRLGFGVLRFEQASEASQALTTMNGSILIETE